MKPVLSYILIPAIAIAVLSLYPQFNLWITNGPAWQGAYFVSNYDEVAYSAYVNALVNGKPRKNDPFVGIDDPTYESLYSIQFIPAYGVAVPARFLGISTSSAFIILSVFVAIGSVIALFWFINGVTEEPILAATGTVIILCLGTAIAFEGELSHWIKGRVLIDFFPFLRRYQPGFAFPIFFVFCGLVWRSFNKTALREALIYAAASGITFAVLVFSYFYLWTAAAAWLGCVAILGLIGNKENRRRILYGTAIIGGFAAASLIPYFMLLSNRSPNLDSVQLLTNTHSPNLASPSMILGLVMLAVVGVLAYRRRVSFNEPITLLAVSFAVTPTILFNQQILTGRSLQPIHYEIFMANYLVLTAAVLFAGVLLRSDDGLNNAKRKMLKFAAVVAIVWGVVEAAGSTSRNSDFGYIRDASIPAIHFIEQSEPKDRIGDNRPVVLATNFVTADFIPTVSTFRPLWNAHTSSAGGVSTAENRRLFYLYLYYSGFTSRDLEEALKLNVFEVTAAVFGSERALPALGRSTKPISADEIRAETSKYERFSGGFTAGDATNPKLSYLIVPEKAEPDMRNIDRWYIRDSGEVLGVFKVYKLVQKTEP